MNAQDMEQRQTQIKKLHKKIREYKLDPEEIKILQNNKIELEINIDSKFFNCKSNHQYKFPLTQQFTDSSSLPSRQKQIYNLYSQNDNLSLDNSPWQNYKVPDKKIISSPSLSFDNNHYISQKCKIRQNLSNRKLESDQIESIFVRSIDKNTERLSEKAKILTQKKNKQQQLELSEDVTAFKIPQFNNVAKLKKCLKKTENGYSQKQIINYKMINIKQKQNINNQKKLNIVRRQLNKNTSKNNLNNNNNQSLKKIYLLKPSYKQNNKNLSKVRSGLFIIHKSQLEFRNKLYPQSCKSSENKFFKNKEYQTRIKSNQNYRIFIDNISTQSKTKSKQKNKKDTNKGLQILKPIQNISSIHKSILNPNSTFHTNSNNNIKQNKIIKSSYRLPINLCSPINKRIKNFIN